MKLPIEFENYMKDLLKADYDNYYHSLSMLPTKGMRVNITKTNENEILSQFNGEKIPYAYALYADNEKYGGHPFHHAGLIYMQEPSSMLPVSSIDFNGDELVLDLCAAPGGKSGQIAELIPNGTLLSNEINNDRAKILKQNIERLGYRNTIITNSEPKKIEKLGDIFDIVLVDAPCSGEGMFRKEPIAISEWYAQLPYSNANRQLLLLDSASKLVKAGGKIIYSTCTFNKMEDEDVVSAFLKTHEDFIAIETNSRIHPFTIECENYGRKLMPHIARGEGQFMCVMQKADNGTLPKIKQCRFEKLGSSQKVIVDKFLKEVGLDLELNLKAKDDMIYILPPKPIDTSALYMLSYGVVLGKIEKGRLIPSHNFFTAYGDNLKNKVNFDIDNDNINKYLQGEELYFETDLKGYASFQVNGHTLGAVKISDNTLKNHYPKGIRKK